MLDHEPRSELMSRRHGKIGRTHAVVLAAMVNQDKMSHRTSCGEHALTDVDALLRNRRRANAGTVPTFLHDAAAQEIGERLNDIPFNPESVGLVTGWPNLWKPHFPDADLIPDDDLLCFDRHDYDLIIHAMSLHWANDLVGQLIQCRMAIRSDGLFLACLAGGETLAGLRNALVLAEMELSGGASPRVAPMSDIRDLGALLQRAGFSMPVADRARIDASYGSMLDLMLDVRAMGEANALSARSDRFATRRLFKDAESHYRASHGLPDGRVSATFELMFLTGRISKGCPAQQMRHEALSTGPARPNSTGEARLQSKDGQ